MTKLVLLVALLLAAEGKLLHVNVGGGALKGGIGRDLLKYRKSRGVRFYRPPTASKYNSHAWVAGKRLVYRFPVKNGLRVKVTAQFAETYKGNFRKGKRLLDVYIGGVLRADNLDVFARRGGNKLVSVSRVLTVRGGAVEIRVVGVRQNPMLTGVIIDRVSGRPGRIPAPKPKPPKKPSKKGPTNRAFQKVKVIWRKPVKRHEGCGVFCNGLYYVIGGRGKNRGIWAFNPKTRKWAPRKHPGKELHHMQCVCVGKKIYVPGAWSGPFPKEKAYKQMFVYNTVRNSWSDKLRSPGGWRLRGSSAVGVFGTSIIMSTGSTGGHGKPTTVVPYTDVFDTKRPWQGWKKLSDIPDARDHTAGAVVGHYFCVAGGRDGSKPNFKFWLTRYNTAPINCLDLRGNRNQWRWKRMANLPNPRGGVAAGVTCDGLLMVAGGEAIEPRRRLAYRRVDLFDPVANKVLKPLMMKRGRHGTGLGITDCKCGNVYIAAGSGHIGGGPELNDIEVWHPSGRRKMC